MTEEEQNVFEDGVDMPEEEAPVEQEQKKTEDLVEEEFEIGDFSSSSQKDYKIQFEEEDVEVVKDVKYLKQAMTVEKVEISEPRLKDTEGNFIPPMAFNPAKPDARGYKVKLKVYYKDSDYISYLPSVRWYVGTDKKTGKKRLNPWIDTRIDEDTCNSDKKSVVSKLYYKYCVKENLEAGKVIAKDFIEGMVGKKVKLVQWSDVYNGNKVFRIDIDELLD